MRIGLIFILCVSFNQFNVLVVDALSSIFIEVIDVIVKVGILRDHVFLLCL